jgi:hypothetical protein
LVDDSENNSLIFDDIDWSDSDDDKDDEESNTSDDDQQHSPDNDTDGNETEPEKQIFELGQVPGSFPKDNNDRESRRSERLQEKSPINYKEANAVYEAISYKEALQSKEKIEWVRSLKEEYDNLNELHTWEEVWLPEGKFAIPCKVIMNRKDDGRFRPRLCVRGDLQRKAKDYIEIPVYAPVAGYLAFRLSLAYAASLKIRPKSYDVGNAFPNAIHQGGLYLKIPEGYVESVYGGVWPADIAEGLKQGKQRVLRLLQALYQRRIGIIAL